MAIVAIEPSPELFSPGEIVYLKSDALIRREQVISASARMVVACTEIVHRNVTKHDGARTWQEDADQPLVRVHWLKPCGGFETALVPPECLVREVDQQ